MNERMLKLAEMFEVKLAIYAAEEAKKLPFKNVTSEQLTQLTTEERAEVRAQGQNEEYRPFNKPHNPPSWVANEAIWNKAKKAVKPYKKNYKEPWSVISHVYFNMHGQKKKKK